MIHAKKVRPEYFAALRDGSKTFELRREDPDEPPYAVGDYLALNECESGRHSEEPPHYSGACLLYRITYVLRGMANISRQIKNMQEINPALRVAGLLPTMTYKSEQIAEALRILRLSDFPVFTPIRRTGRVDDTTFARRPLRETSPRSAACVDYRRFVKQYMKGGARRG